MQLVNIKGNQLCLNLPKRPDLSLYSRYTQNRQEFIKKPSLQGISLKGKSRVDKSKTPSNSFIKAKGGTLNASSYLNESVI